ncbi:glycoside hydrolase family 35 protein [Pedobacter sp. SL55]|uniref:glycoside hydrolase family 35 protein n=1 Tax=Pedobacter sp. SL55 TaxID=2995161 RepID=UPI0022709325|nr:beta-galactosidase family protein [Pedobacter sp. SL55]WAC40729.1 beta-galactosidase [Pedobacter sp. SL55]
MNKKLILKLILLSIFLIGFSIRSFAQKKHAFEIKDGHFFYDGKPVQLISGEMHYPRIPHQYWRHRFKMLKAMGLNTIATYVFWNAHETESGEWDFSEDKNLRRYIEIAGEEGLHVILRPGPYACAEWEFGGYPWWLQKVEKLELRSDNAAFLTHTKNYLKRLYQEIGDLQITKGGPIVMIQVENEFGSYAAQRKDIPLDQHRKYNQKIKDQLAEVGFDVPFFTSDGTWLFDGGAIDGVLPTANGEGNIANLKKAVDQYHNGKGPYMVAEFYPGWLAHWAEPHPAIDASIIARKTEEYLQNDVSFNLYMAHGGTNFGFTSGANYDKKHGIQPDLTSYDYDAPISEAGWVTPKFDSLRNVIKKYAKYSIPSVPAPNKVIEIQAIKLSKAADVLSMLEKQKAVQNNTPLTFEKLNQGHGYVLYSRKFNQPISGQLNISGLRDYAVVYVNGEKVGELNRYYNQYSIAVDIPFNSTLDILVENMGRINYGAEIVHNNKGIIAPITINNIEIEGNWEMYKLPMDNAPVFDNLSKSDVYNVGEPKAKALQGRPAFYEGTFNLSEAGDTFLNMEDWGKGIVFVNGKNLGRYWQVGPQQTLFVPGVWLKKEKTRL